VLLANCAGSFLLLLLFLVLLSAAVGLVVVARYLRLARRELPGLMARAEGYALTVEETTHTTAEAVVEPQIRVASAWAGLKAGARALLGRGDPEPGDDAHGRPPL
jgi:hypothetical protein